MSRRLIYPPKIVCPKTINIVHRVRLFNLLDDARQQAKIIWIAAPGGSGKTTLVSSYLNSKQVAHCWYQIDEDDRDLSTFFHYLGLAGKLAAPRRKKAVPKLSLEYRQGIPAFTRHFFKDISSRLQNNGIIVLDNFQLIPETDPIPVLLPNIVDSLASGISLVITSRYLPPESMIEFVAKRQLLVIDTNLMRFEENEWLDASQLFNSKHSQDALLSLHQKLNGWIAGLVLLPETPSAIDKTKKTGLGIEILDTYIAEQFLSSLNAETSNLLMKVCYMPHITPRAATLVSHIADSKKLLAGLAQKNLFVLQQGDKGYTLHPLVREYLKQRAKDTLSQQELHHLQLSTAVALIDENEHEAAADLLLELNEWQELLAVILNHATELYDSGRITSLQRYINALPQEFSKHEPWINFWKGKISVYTDVTAALNLYDIAYIDFMKKSDVKGLYMSWCAAVSVICNTLLGGDRLVTWVTRYNELCTRYPEPPQMLQKGFVEAKLLQSYYCSGLEPEKRDSLQVSIAGAIDQESNPLMRLHMMSNYVHVAVISGIREKDKEIIERFENQLDDMKDDPVLYLGALTFCSLGASSFNDFDKVLDLERRALEVAKEHGISVFNCHIYTKIVIAALGLNKFDLARKYINIMKENIAEKDQVYQSLYLMCIIYSGTYMNEPCDLSKAVKPFMASLESTHCPPFILHNKLFYVYYLCVKKQSLEALELHNDLLEQVHKLAFSGQTTRFYMIYAKIFFDNGELGRCDHYLNECFSVARRNELITYVNWNPELMAWACQRALSLEIETMYVKKFVEIHYANLPHPDPICMQWPWSFRIYTFGGFELKTRSEIIHQKKYSDKVFALLKTLVKAHDRSLKSESVKEKLYSDDNHDKASQSLDTQIHRLRKRLGNERTILRQGDEIKLNLKYFWIDTQEFEALGKQTITQENAMRVANRLQELYKGEYLPDDEELDVIAHRERFRNMYLATLFKCIDCMDAETDKAIEFCQNALVLEPLSEPLYRKLIATYLKQDNRDMAEVTQEQCRKMVKHHIGCDVSRETLSLLQGS